MASKKFVSNGTSYDGSFAPVSCVLALLSSSGTSGSGKKRKVLHVFPLVVACSV